jgi:hypothetical protein
MTMADSDSGREARLLDDAFRVAMGSSDGLAVEERAVEVRCDEAGGRDRYRFERSADLTVDLASATPALERIAEGWAGLGFRVEVFDGAPADCAVFGTSDAVSVSVVVGDLGDGRVLLGVGGSTGCHRRTL